MSSLTSNLYRFGEFSLDPQTRLLKRAGAAVSLTPKAFEVLLVLVRNGGRIVSKEELMNAVWPNSFVEESNLTQTIFMVRKALEETGDRRYIGNVQGQGYRFLVPVTETSGAEAEEIPTSAVEAAAFETPAVETRTIAEVQPRPRTSGTRFWRPVVAACALALLIVVSGVGLWRSRRASAEPPMKIMLAVLPFENFTGDAGQDYFSDGLTEEMISQLGNLDPAHLGVIARTSIMRYKHSPAPIPQIGKDLGVQYVIEGSVRRDSERVRITAQLILVHDQSRLWAREYDRDLSHLLQLQEEIAREVANELEFSLSGRRPIEAAGAGTVATAGAKADANSYDAYDSYLKGRYFWNKRTADGFRQAADYFQKAIDKDANYGPAYAGLADTFSLMSTWYLGPQQELMPRARTAALRALELDEGLAEAHASLALIKENYEYDWAGAEKEFRRAIQLNPQYATGHQWYAEFLAWQGRFSEAFAESERARQLDPLSLIIASDHASIVYYTRQFAAARKEYASMLELDPDFGHAGSGMVACDLQLGRYDDVREVLNRWTQHGEKTWSMAWEAAVDFRLGHPDEARVIVQKLERLPASKADRTALLLTVYSRTGDIDRAIDLLNQAYADHSNVLATIKVDPLYDPLRNDARFKDLLRRIGLGE